jgi:biotin operon repressor
MPAATSTSTIDAVLDALGHHPDSTAAELALATGLGRSTVSKALTVLETQQKASRQTGGRNGGRKLADRWTPLTEHPPGGEQSAAPHGPAATSLPTLAQKADQSMPAGGKHPTAIHTPHPDRASGRLGKGQLRAAVLAHLHARPGQDHSPTAVAKALGRSAGAVGNALEKLAADGAIIQTSTTPRRFASQPDADHAAFLHEQDRPQGLAHAAKRR